MDLLIIIGFIIYLIPTFVAILRQKKDVLAITLLNVLAGWTLLGWIGALVWAVKND